MQDLETTGYLNRNEDSGRFTIGVQVLTLAYAYLEALDIVRFGQKVIRKLFEETHEFSAVVVPRGLEYVLVCAETPPTLAAHSLQVGHRAPLYCSATGRTMLAYMSSDQCDRILRQSKPKKITPYTITEMSAVKVEIERARKTGVAYSVQEIFVGITALASVVRNAVGTPVGAIATALSGARLDRERRIFLEEATKRAAAELSRQFGWTG